MLTMLSAGTAQAAPSSALRRYPYLTDTVDGWVTVNWATTTSTGPATVRYGPESASCEGEIATATGRKIFVGNRAVTQWKATFRVDPGERVCYRVFLGETDLLGTTPSPTIDGAIAAGDPESFSFVVMGSWGYPYDDPDPIQLAINDSISQSGARFAVGAGGVAFAGAQSDFGDLLSTGARLFQDGYWSVPGRSMPIFAAPGNKGPFFPFITNFTVPHAVSSSGGVSRVETYCCVNDTRSQALASVWYAFDYGRARFYVLDAAWPNGNAGSGSAYENDWLTHWQPDSEEYTWLKRDLETHPGGLKFAFFNFPLYSDAKGHRSDTYLTEGPDSLAALLGDHGVGYAFNGHAHTYQRNNIDENGVVSYVTGGGGAPLGPLTRCSTITAYAIGWNPTLGRGTACGEAPVPTSGSDVHHYLLVEVTSDGVTVTPTDSQGDTFDTQTYDG